METIRTPENRSNFLRALAETCNVTRACALAEISRNAVYDWRDDDADFAEEWDKAKRRGIDSLEDEAIRRAVEKQSDTLLMFILNGNKSDVYRHRVSSEVSGPQGKPIEVNDQSAPDRLAAILAAGAERRDNGEDLA